MEIRIIILCFGICIFCQKANFAQCSDCPDLKTAQTERNVYKARYEEMLKERDKWKADFENYRCPECNFSFERKKLEIQFQDDYIRMKDSLKIIEESLISELKQIKEKLKEEQTKTTNNKEEYDQDIKFYRDLLIKEEPEKPSYIHHKKEKPISILGKYYDFDEIIFSIKTINDIENPLDIPNDVDKTLNKIISLFKLNDYKRKYDIYAVMCVETPKEKIDKQLFSRKITNIRDFLIKKYGQNNELATKFNPNIPFYEKDPQGEHIEIYIKEK